MEFGPMEQMKVIANEVRHIAQTETVIGEPIQAGDATIVPVISVAIGFGAGGASGGPEESKAIGAGGGGGAGLSLTPVAFLVVKGDDIRLLPIKETAIGGLAASVPKLVEAFLDRKKEPKQKAARKSVEPADAGDG